MELDSRPALGLPLAGEDELLEDEELEDELLEDELELDGDDGCGMLCCWVCCVLQPCKTLTDSASAAASGITFSVFICSTFLNGVSQV